ncbi:MAG: hypothetical protein KC502_23775, partial [Myxococcales bacterium]|nr:hypothetical protein [Myxococcales bacterium]
VFPYFYTYFTRLFLHLFLFVLPLALASRMDWHVVPLSTAVSFVYMILDKVGHVTEEPFKPRSSGTPLSAICRVIEIDILQMLGETELPPPFEVKLTRHGAEFID